MGHICGIDEAGRGPLAGPVTAAAVVLAEDFDTTVLNDSKKLGETARNRIRSELYRSCSYIGVGWAWPEEIDRFNIHVATLVAMRRAYEELVSVAAFRIDTVLVDGKFVPPLDDTEKAPAEARAIVGGDSLIPEIMAASIIAKVTRDRWMLRYAWIEPEYGFDKHKGYPTKEHRRRCLLLGPSSIQRNTFRVRGNDIELP